MAQKNFFENARTQLRDSGYNDRVDIHFEQDINVNVSHATVNVLELKLPLDVRKTILEALRGEQDAHVIEGEVTK